MSFRIMDTTRSLRQVSRARARNTIKKMVSNKKKAGMWNDTTERLYTGACRDGDMVIVFGSHTMIEPLRLQTGGILNNKFGSFRHDDIIGKPFGSRVRSSVPKVVKRGSRKNSSGARKGEYGWIFALAPTAELWTEALAHRTQIIYSMDASAITWRLGLVPGSVVLESGTGSGSLSTHFIRAVLPTGRLHTFEFHAGRAAQAREEFVDNNFGDAVTVECRDVCADGFGEALRGTADAVFLDLPKPWLAVPHAIDALKCDGRVCSFSPCVEQVQLTCDALRAHGFRDLTTWECLRREVRVEQVQWSTPQCITRHLEAVAGGGEGGDEAGEQQQQEEEAAADANSSASAAASTAATTATEASASAAPAPPAATTTTEQPATKRQRTGVSGSATASRRWKPTDVAVTTAAPSTGVRPFAAARGHTSYLTFGRLYPTHATAAAAPAAAAAAAE